MDPRLRYHPLATVAGPAERSFQRWLLVEGADARREAATGDASGAGPTPADSHLAAAPGGAR
jgi:hypothetical protein